MNNLKEKIEFYKEKKKLEKEKLANEYMLLSKETTLEYSNISNMKELFDALIIYSGLSVTTHTSLLIYTILNDNNLKYDITNIINNGITPITNDINNDYLYKYLPLMILVSSMLFTKLFEINKEINIGKNILEEKEPKLLGYKYIDYIKK